MPKWGKIAIAILLSFLLVAGAGMFLVRLFSADSQNVVIDQGDTGGTGPDLTEEHSVIGSQSTRNDSPQKQEPDSDETEQENDVNSIMEHVDGPVPVGFTRNPSGMALNDGTVPLPEEAVPEHEPQDSSVLQGSVGYDDIPDASLIDGDYGTDLIKRRIIEYIEETYPTETIEGIQLMGNGSAQSQETGEATSYINYLVNLSKGQRIGISVTCSESLEPYVMETNYLVINPTLLYKVAEDEYVPMTAAEE